MKPDKQIFNIETIPVNQIKIVNPRVRNQKTFREIVDSIEKVGLKRPITVSKNQKDKNSEFSYNLVCGQGRLEAIISLGQAEIPAIVSDVDDEDLLIMSLVENIARRRHQPLELLNSIGELVNRGYSVTEIARKVGLSKKYISSICMLLDEGEERLLSAVGSGCIPINVAIEIAETDEEGAQEALANAYQDGQLRGKKLSVAKRLLEQRKLRGKELNRGGGHGVKRPQLSSTELVKAYEQETQRQRMLIKKAEITQNRLLFIVEAIRELISDENFITLLRAENLATMPKPLAELVSQEGTCHHG